MFKPEMADADDDEADDDVNIYRREQVSLINSLIHSFIRQTSRVLYYLYLLLLFVQSVSIIAMMSATKNFPS